MKNSPSRIPQVEGVPGYGLDARNFLPDLQKDNINSGLLHAIIFGYPRGEWVLKSSNSTSIKYSEDWVSGSIPPDLTYRQALLNCHPSQCLGFGLIISCHPFFLLAITRKYRKAKKVYNKFPKVFERLYETIRNTGRAVSTCCEEGKIHMITIHLVNSPSTVIIALDGSDMSCGNGTKCSSVCDSVVSVPCLGNKE